MNQGGNQGYQGYQNYRGRGGRGGFQPGRPQASKKETLKFEGEYDFDKANEEFKEVLEKLQVSNCQDFPTVLCTNEYDDTPSSLRECR